MPGEFTHIVLIESFIDNFVIEESLKSIIKKHLITYKLGALTPDLFYFSNGTYDYISDKIHEYKTDAIPHFFIQKIKKSREEDLVAFLMGYVSHMVADAVFHPFVNEKVGQYETHKEEHTQFERELDVIICYGLLNKEPIINSRERVIGDLKNGLTKNIISSLFSIISEVYSPNIYDGIFADLVKAMDNIFSAKKDSLEYEKFLGLYPSYESLAKKREDISNLNENSIFGRKIDIFKDCIPVFFSSYEELIGELWRSLSKSSIPCLIPPVNLTTGYCNDSNKPFFWTT